MIIPRTWFFLSHVLKMLLVEHVHWYTVWRFVECGGCANRPQTRWGLTSPTPRLREALVDYGNSPDNAYSQGVQELNASAGAC